LPVKNNKESSKNPNRPDPSPAGPSHPAHVISFWALERYILNGPGAVDIPDDTWTMYIEALPVIGRYEFASGGPLPDGSVVDNSMGQHFCKFLKKRGINPSSFATYVHRFPDGRAVEAKAYPNDLLPDFRRWLRSEYEPKIFPKYLKYVQEKAAHKRRKAA
jgi:hypothetical protein